MDTLDKLQVVKLSAVKPGPVKVRGWLEKVTAFKKHSICVLRDGVGKESRIQVYIPASVASSLVQESYVEITGTVQELPTGKHSFRPFELQASQLLVLGKSCSDFSSRCPPDAGPEVRLDQRHLFIRYLEQGLTIKLRAILARAVRETYEEMGCVEIIPSLFVGCQCEGGATLFELDYPVKGSETKKMKVYLAQSSQPTLEKTVPAVGGCYCFSQSFRAETSDTRRHLTEFPHVESEHPGIDTLEDLLDIERFLVKGIVSKFLHYGRKYLEELGLVEHVEKCLKMCSDIITLTHREAIEYCRSHEIFKDEDKKIHFEFEDDIPEKQERIMVDQMDKMIFLVKFHRSFKSFYMLRDPKDREYVLGCDLETPQVGEVLGSGLRVYDSDELLSALKEQGLREEDYSEYMDLRKYGSGRTAGLGLGFDRFLTWLLKAYTIRDVVTFPHVPGRVYQ